MLTWNQLLSAEAVTELKLIGAHITTARKHRHLSVSALAERIGVDRRTLSQLEKGNPAVSLGVFFQVLSTLNLLRGLQEVVRPENDIEAISSNIRKIRKRIEPKKEIDAKKVNF